MYVHQWTSLSLGWVGIGNAKLQNNSWWSRVPFGTNFCDNQNTNMFFFQETAFENVVCKLVAILFWLRCINILRLRENGHDFANDIFKCTFVKEIVLIPIEISLKFVPEGHINKIPTLVQIMAWHHPGDKPLSVPTMVCLLMHICVTWPQRVKCIKESGMWLLSAVCPIQAQ